MTGPVTRFRGRLAALTPSDRRALIDRGAAGKDVREAVRTIVAAVREGGDDALRRLTAEFDGVVVPRFEVTAERRRAALESIPVNVRQALARAAGNIERAHQAWLPRGARVEPEPGVELWRMPFPLARVGIYAPGGRAAYPSSVLMGVVPARVAGVGEVIVVSPPGSDGLPSPLVLAAAEIGKADRVFAVGGAQAIAALAFGTESVPRVDRIFGPGNAWVTEAKLQVSHRVGIDNPAGPSEVLVVTDSTQPDFVAGELVAQAEHDPDAAVVALAIGDELALTAVEAALERAVAVAPRRQIVAASLSARGGVLSVQTLEEAVDFANHYAAEHLLLAFDGADRARVRFTVAGSVFVGRSSSVAFGDYLTGANHVLPTAGLARSYSGLGPDDFVRWTTYQTISPDAAARLAADTAILATAEGLPGHAAAARLWSSND